jgi:hypothetical protein
MRNKEYRACREDLIWDLLGVVGSVATPTPTDLRPGSKLARAGGCHFGNEPLRMGSPHETDRKAR